ncbi:MAG: helix-turn-helix domain-containing protein, partial [Myxococcota bacterium]
RAITATLDDPFIEGLVEKAVCHACWLRGEVDTSRIACDRALEAWPRALPNPLLPVARALTYTLDTWLRLDGGEGHEALTNAEQSITLLEADGASSELAARLCSLARFYIHTGAFDAAEAAIFRSLDLAREAAHPYYLSTALSTASRFLIQRERWDEVDAVLGEGLHLARRSGLQANVLNLLTRAAQKAQVCGDENEARRLYNQVLAARRRSNDQRLLSVTVGLLAGFERECDNLATARLLIQESLEIDRAASDIKGVISNLAGWGALEAEAGNAEQARALLEQANTLLHDCPHATLERVVEIEWGALDLLLASQDDDAALTRAKQRLLLALEPQPLTLPNSQPRLRYQVSLAVRSAGRRLARRMPEKARCETWAKALDPDQSNLVAFEGTALFRIPGGAWHDLSRQETLKRVAWAIVHTAYVNRDTLLSSDELIAHGWPDDTNTMHDAAINRLYQALSRLRRKGFKGLITAVDGGYRLTQDIDLCIAPARI